MDFGSTREFKEAILQHSILNDEQVKFIKNDEQRVKVGVIVNF